MSESNLYDFVIDRKMNELPINQDKNFILSYVSGQTEVSASLLDEDTDFNKLLNKLIDKGTDWTDLTNELIEWVDDNF